MSVPTTVVLPSRAKNFLKAESSIAGKQTARSVGRSVGWFVGTAQDDWNIRMYVRKRTTKVYLAGYSPACRPPRPLLQL